MDTKLTGYVRKGVNGFRFKVCFKQLTVNKIGCWISFRF